MNYEDSFALVAVSQDEYVSGCQLTTSNLNNIQNVKAQAAEEALAIAFNLESNEDKRIRQAFLAGQVSICKLLQQAHFAVITPVVPS